MKKIINSCLALIFCIVILVSPVVVLAAPVDPVLGKVIPPPQVSSLGFGAAGISQLLSNVVTLIYIAAGIVFLFMVAISAFQWIVSGGDKESIAKARGRLTWAIVGITVLALAFVIIGIISQITGVKFF